MRHRRERLAALDVGHRHARHEARRRHARAAARAVRGRRRVDRRGRALAADDRARCWPKSTASRCPIATRSTCSIKRSSARGRSRRWTTASAKRTSDRIAAYMEKALREAKLHTSWMNPATDLRASGDGVRSHAARRRRRRGVSRRTRRVRRGASPTPGSSTGWPAAAENRRCPACRISTKAREFWDFNLVDPDNRRPVDFDRRRRIARRLAATVSPSRPRRWPPRLAAPLAAIATKQFVAWRALATRAAHADVFAYGEYVPLAASGAARDACLRLRAAIRRRVDSRRRAAADTMPARRTTACRIGLGATRPSSCPRPCVAGVTNSPERQSSIRDGRVASPICSQPLPVALLTSRIDVRENSNAYLAGTSVSAWAPRGMAAA